MRDPRYSQSLFLVSLLMAAVYFPQYFARAADTSLLGVDLHGGLVVQIGAAETAEAATMSRSGRFLVHLLDPDVKIIDKAQVALRKDGCYGMAFAEVLRDPAHLPYAENVVNAVVMRSPSTLSLVEIHRVITPLGHFVAEAGVDERLTKEALEVVGFEQITVRADGSLTARKPWPTGMDAWSHPRHGADGNPVSHDTTVGPPERVRWIAAALEEVEGLVTEAGRNFYGGILARDSFNGLRLWDNDLEKGTLNNADFRLPRLNYTSARPVASAKYVFAVVKGKFSALNAVSGEVVRIYDGIEEPDEIISHRDIVVAADENQVCAFSVETGEMLWRQEAGDPRNLAAESETVTFLRGRPKRGEKSEVLALDLYSGKLKWQNSEYPWLDHVYRTVMHDGQMAFEVSSLSDHDAGNALHLASSESGTLEWEKIFAPGMNHNRQARAMFTDDDLWILHGGKENTETKETTTRSLIEVSALDPKTGETKKTHSAGLAHCFPPVATPKYVFAGVMDLTDMNSGEIVANRMTKANCSRENGWVPANGLIYTTPKHCTCWPMLRGFVAMAPAIEGRDDVARKPVESIEFPVRKGTASADPAAAIADASDWPTYRGDRWRSGSNAGKGPETLDTKWSVKIANGAAVPSGPIASDWKENPYVKGVLSAPVIANGTLFVARPDAHEVVALSSSDGSERWRYTARGRVDSPPTIHRGLCLFGCHSGYAYAVKADTGELVWEMRVAPSEERIVAFGQVESPWPVPGATLVRGETAYFVAGRQPLADGGVFVVAVDAMSGVKQWAQRIDTIPHKEDPTFKNPYEGFYENSGLEFDPIDILHEEGDGIAMSRWLLTEEGKKVDVDKWNAFARLDTGGGAVWVPRGTWTYGARHQDRFRGEAPDRPLVVFHDGQVYGQLDGSTDLFRRDFDAEGLEKFNGKWITGWEAAQKGNKGEKPFRTYRIAEGAKWTVDPFTAAGSKTEPVKPGEQLANHINALAMAAGGRLYASHDDGRLKILNTTDGSILAERTVPAVSWDGLAIAEGRVFLTTRSGEVMCLGD
ncbi:MAG: PQQ-binding-like beta-propeller repeat protein [Verrucomicrobiales bacterium]|nr:PQQ-binding-like beta-propeller repeat protein [Verrucomicrobiales bacterium]